MGAKTNRKDDMPESYSRPRGRHQASRRDSEDRLDTVGVATSPRAHSVDDAETRVSTVVAPTGHVPGTLPARIHLLVQSRSTTCTAPGRPPRAPGMWRRGGGDFDARATANGNRTATRCAPNDFKCPRGAQPARGRFDSPAASPPGASRRSYGRGLRSVASRGGTVVSPRGLGRRGRRSFTGFWRWPSCGEQERQSRVGAR
jgi:hypothetical protein